MAYQYQQQMQAEDESQWNIQLLTNTKDFFRDLWKKITKN
jgi:hypothetical protein